MHANPGFNASQALYWATLPPPADVLSPELFTDAQLQLLQIPELERLLRLHRTVAANVFYGNNSWGGYAPLPEVVAGTRKGATVSLDAFCHLAGIIGTRDFALSELVEGAAGPGGPTFFLVPVADMVNHADVASAERRDNGTHLLMTATRDLAPGDAVTNNYQSDVIHRNDMSLYIYGFVQESSAARLCAVDLPTYEPSAPFGSTADDDSAFHGPGGRFNTPAELARLRALLEKMPTSEAEDAALLESGSLPGWKEETIVRFRMWRKAALRKAAEAVEAALGTEAAAAASESASDAKDEL